LTCLPPGSNPPPPGGTGAPDPNTPVGPEPDDPDPDDEVDEDDLTCALDPDDPDAGGEDGGDDEGWTTTTTFTPGGGTTTRVTTIFTTPPITTPRTTTTIFTTKQPVQTVTQKKSPDFSRDEVKCYDSGQVANRAKLISTADGWCKSNKNKKLESRYYSGELLAPFSCCDTRDEVVPVEVKYSVEVHDGCKWKVDETTCKAEFRKVIDGCDRNTEARKQGGRLVGDYMTWRLDPNAQS
jgi:chitinase